MAARVLPSVLVLALVAWGSPAWAQEDRYIVAFDSPAQGRAALAAAGATIVLELPEVSAVAARIPAAALPGLARHPAIRYVEVDARRYPDAQAIPWGIEAVQAPQVWSSTLVANRTVCVIDSGYYLDHEDNQSAGVTGYPQNWSTDGCGHGTHVAGTIAALDNALGVVGVLPGGVDLHVVRVFGNDCRWTYASTLVDAAYRCRDAGASVINMSLGGSSKSATEERAFADLDAQGLLSVAAAGNEGSGRPHYPASYSSVLSVAAVDSDLNRAAFSQANDQVELAAPGVDVLSTVPEENSLTVAGTEYLGNWIEFAARGQVSGALADGGLCTAAGAWSGKVVLCERGTNDFLGKVSQVEAGGGVAAVVYNNEAGSFSGTLGSGNTSTIPAISLSQADGQALVAGFLGVVGTLVSETPGSGYGAWSGTSMACPHVAGVAASIWSQDPSWTNTQVRDALAQTAVDLGAPGRDREYGHGLVQAKAALDLLLAGGGGGGGGGEDPPVTGLTLTATPGKLQGFNYVALAWSGATSELVDVLRDDSPLVTTENDGSYRDELGRGPFQHTYQVCEHATSTCSAVITVTN